jgi:hypothetical protein
LLAAPAGIVNEPPLPEAVHGCRHSLLTSG